MLAAYRSQIGADDGEVDVGDALDGFEFDHDLVADEQVQAMQTDLDGPVEDGHGHLALEGHKLGRTVAASGLKIRALVLLPQLAETAPT